MPPIEPTHRPKTPDAPNPGAGTDPRVPDQREDQPLKEINDPPHDQKQAGQKQAGQKQAGQDLRDPQEHDPQEHDNAQ